MFRDFDISRVSPAFPINGAKFASRESKNFPFREGRQILPGSEFIKLFHAEVN